MSTERCPTCDAPVAEMRSRLRDEEMIAAGWLPPDEAEQLKAALANMNKNAETLADEVVHAHAQIAAMEPVVKLLWPDGGAKRVPFDYAHQLPDAVEWLLQQRVSLTEAWSEAEARLAAVQPVIDAARAWVQAHARHGAARLLTCEDEAALIAAVDALDAARPLEGPKQ